MYLFQFVVQLVYIYFVNIKFVFEEHNLIDKTFVRQQKQKIIAFRNNIPICYSHGFCILKTMHCSTFNITYKWLKKGKKNETNVLKHSMNSNLRMCVN